ncbi:MAG: hypothetical protein ACFFBR_02015 [Promethearchaeota archaeon]
MHFITKILNGTIDDIVHRNFLRYGRGVYPGPAAEITVTKAGKVKMRSTHMYQDLPASVMVSIAPVETVTLAGLILGYEPLDEILAELGFKADPSKKKPRTLLFQSKLTGKYSPKQVAPLYGDIPELAYVFCTLNTTIGWTHKPKTKIPSAQKEPPLKERLKFCTTTVPDGNEFLNEVLNQLVPDFLDELPSGFSTLQIANSYDIQNLIFPPDMKRISSKDVRLKTKRSGILHRTLLVDGKEFNKKHPMSV